MIGKSIYQYKILKKLGEGGMGVVYLAEDTSLERKVALKFLPLNLTRDKEAKDRFKREAKVSAALNHPNIVTIHEINEYEGQIYIAMEYVEGRTLKDKISSSPLSVSESIDIALQIAEGLKTAHKNEIVHRDIKPANIIVSEDGKVKTLDFGLARLKGSTKLTEAGTTLGTIAYMSPEQALGKAADHRSDIWSLGVVLYLMITGQLPFMGEYDQAIIYSIINKEPEPVTGLRSGIPMQFERIINKALAKEPEKRYQNISDLIVDLKSVLEGEISAAEVLPTSKSKIKNMKKAPFYAGIPVVLALIIIFGINYFSGGKITSSSIAVLPFQNLSQDKEQDYFVDGMHDTLLTELTKIRSLKIISRTTVMKYKSTKKSIPEIARELKVKWIVEGSAIMAGGIIRINAQLIEGKSDHHLWAEKYDRKYEDILKLHSMVARDISREIKIKLAPGEREQLEKAQVINPEAHKAYLKGRFFWNKQTPSDIKKARDYFRDALKKDPDYTPAYTGLFRASFDLAQTILPATDREGIKKAKEEARSASRKAMELDNNFSESHYSKALISYYFDWDWAGAHDAFIKALESNPNDVLAHIYFADFLWAIGLHDQALSHSRQAVELDPLSPIANLYLGTSFYFLHQSDQAIEQLKKTLELDPHSIGAFVNIGHILCAQGKEKEAMEWWAKMHESYGNKVLAKKFRETSFEGALEAWLDQVMGPSPAIYANEHSIAWVYAKLGDKKKAYDWLEKAYNSRHGCILYISKEPMWDFFRSDTKFQDIIRMMRLPAPEDLK